MVMPATSAAAVAVSFRDAVELAFGVFDLRLDRHIERRVLRGVDRLLAELFISSAPSRLCSISMLPGGALCRFIVDPNPLRRRR
jgi:hypothetical protein